MPGPHLVFRAKKKPPHLHAERRQSKYTMIRLIFVIDID